MNTDRTTTCTVKNGPHTGAKYFPATRYFWREKRYSLDVRAPWRAKASEARADAEALGWRYVSFPSGEVILCPAEG